MNITKSFCALAIFLLIFSGCQSSKKVAAQTESRPVIEKTPEIKPPKTESAEEKAVRLAEEFIKRNGYTDAPADKDNLSNESIEFSSSIDELLKERHDTLAPQAYGILYRGKGDKEGWTVAFQYSKKMMDEIKKTKESNSRMIGRAVTMDKNFENLRVEHVDLFLDKLDKKF